jgi:tol-pal system protein YbgF
VTRLHLALALLVALASGCGAASSSSQEGTLPESTADARLSDLEEARRQQDEEIRALRSELALARGEAETLRSAQSTTRVATISIRGGTDGADDHSATSQFSGTSEAAPEPVWIEPDAGEVVVAEPRQDERGPRPVLRVRGVPSADVPTTVVPPGSAPPGFAAGGADASAPPAPPAAAGQLGPLPVPPIPLAAPAGSPPSFASAGPLPAAVAAGGTLVPVAPEPRTQALDVAVVAYRAALAKLRDRQYGEAIVGFDSFLATNAQHPYAANARYWRAEAMYAQRQYRDALHAFEVFVQRHAGHAKVADALLKMGLCHARSGDTGRARALFQRVQQEYPDTVAARIASREEAS